MPQGAPPTLALTCRVYAKAVGILSASLLDSHAIFWPNERLWPGVTLSPIWDEESADDRAAASAVSRKFPDVRHLWEPAPPPGTLCGKMRGIGYDRQQYSNFVQDLLFTGADAPEYLGVPAHHHALKVGTHEERHVCVGRPPLDAVRRRSRRPYAACRTSGPHLSSACPPASARHAQR